MGKIFFDDIVELYKDVKPVTVRQILNGETPVVNTDKTKVAHILAGKVLEYRENKQLTEAEYKNVMKVIFELDNNFEVLLQYYEEQAILAVEQSLSNPDYKLPYEDNKFFNLVYAGKFFEYIEKHYTADSSYTAEDGVTDLKKFEIDNFIKFTHQLDDETAILIIKKLVCSNYNIRCIMLNLQSWLEWSKVYKHILLYNQPCREDNKVAF